MRLEFKGLEEISAQLKKNVNMDDIKQAVRTNSAEMTRNAQLLAPVDTGRMKGSTTIFSEAGGLAGGTRVHTDYAGYVNNGTRFMAAQPFLTNSFKLQGPKFIRDLEMLVK